MSYWLLVILAAALLLAPPICAWITRWQDKKDREFWDAFMGADRYRVRRSGGNS